MSISVQGIEKSFTHGPRVLHKVGFDAGEGEMVAFLGPSGSGKTTLLRIIAGLESPTAGEVSVRGRRVDHIPVQKRGIGVVFQNYALFKHMTVFDNIAFGLKVQKMSRKDIQDRVFELLDLVRLTGLENRYPSQLSGGQSQRVALARALAPQPSVLLLDEPFSAVDANVRKELRQWVRRLQEQIGITSIFVTHDQEEAFEVADKVLILNQGQVEQYGTPRSVFDHPATRFVAKFVGDVNEYAAVREGDTLRAGGLRLPVLPELAQISAQGTGTVAIRPMDIRLHTGLLSHHGTARVDRITFRGDHEIIDLSFNAELSLRAQMPSADKSRYAIGDAVSIEVTRYTWFGD